MKSLETTVCQIAAAGAVLAVPDPIPAAYLVGELSWITPHRIFWFTAHGDRADDGHLVDFDRVELAGRQSARFFRDDRCVAELTPIPLAKVDDTDDYAVAFSIWQQVAPAYHSRIEQAREAALAAAEPLPVVTAAAAVVASIDGMPAIAGPDRMPKPEMDALLAEVERGAISVKTAMSLMALNGVRANDAALRVFRALGGRDETEVGPDGRARYVGTGKLVAEVEQSIGSAFGAVGTPLL